MATREKNMMGGGLLPDSSGDVFPEPVEVAIATTAANLEMLGMSMNFPTGADIGFYGSFIIPQDYVDTPVLVIRGILNGNSGDVAFGLQQTGGIADNETADVAFETEDLGEFDSSTYSDEDAFELTFAITPAAAYSPGDQVKFFFFRDDSQDTTTFKISLDASEGLALRYNNA